MRILHYFPGIHRQGGLNRYAADLAAAQAAAGNQVFGLFPGGGVLPRRRAKIRSRQTVKGVKYYELLGGVPIPLLEGIRDPEMILKTPHRLSGPVLKKFCDRIRPDVFHIHTWMGFPQELLSELKRRKVRIVFTTHDYFGLCPKVNFIDDMGGLCSGPDNAKCTRCNRFAPGARYLALRNWSLLMKFKPLLMPLARLCRRQPAANPPAAAIKDYAALQAYYRNLLLSCDNIHFNSNVSATIYREVIPGLSGRIIPITHGGIADRRKPHRIENEKIRLCFIGSAAPYKGLPVLLRVLKELYDKGTTDWSLDIWGAAEVGNGPRMDHVRCRGTFAPSEQTRVFDAADLLVVPSVCWETFGFVVAEALFTGLPVLCSDMAGAQILLEPEMVYHGEVGLRKALERLLGSPAILERISLDICRRPGLTTINDHLKIMDEFYHSAEGTERT